MEQIKAYKFSHPCWNSALIVTEEDGGKALGQDMLGDDEDPSLLKMEEVFFTKEQLEQLPEWDG